MSAAASAHPAAVGTGALGGGEQVLAGQLQDGGTTGTVNILTRKPLEFSKQITAEASIGAVRSDQAKSTDPQLSGLFNYKNDDGTFGVMVQGFSQKRELRREAQEIPSGFFKIDPNGTVAKSNRTWPVSMRPPCSARPCSSRPASARVA